MNTTELTTCPTCQSPMSPTETTPTGRKLRRCSTGKWNPETRKTEGCPFVQWIQEPPRMLDTKCPQCNAPLIEQITRFGKKIIKCSTGGWDSKQKVATGCTYVEWGDKKENLTEQCPECGASLVLQTTSRGKKLKKCSTGGWDSKQKVATGCTYVEWLKKGA